jgi:CRP-like cAMP-binding protein
MQTEAIESIKLAVNVETFGEISRLLRAAGHDHAVTEEGINMQGVLLSPSKGSAALKEVDEVLVRFKIEPRDWLKILSCYTTEARLRVAFPLLVRINQSLKIVGHTHSDLARLCCCSREKMTRALKVLVNKRLVRKAGTRAYEWLGSVQE